MSVETDLLKAYLRGFDPTSLDEMGVEQVLHAEDIEEMRREARTVKVDDEILSYISAVVGRTREHPAVDLGASPRASIALLLCSQVLALGEGRDYVVPDDIKELASPILRHRFLLHPDAELDGTSPDDVIAEILADVRVPGGRDQ